MLPDIPTIIECPHCHNRDLKESLVSGNTYGALYWTDRKCEAPMLTEFSEITVCHICQRPFWVEDAKEIDQLSTRDPARKDIPRLSGIEFPSILTYYSCRGTDLVRNTDDEIHIRRSMWWCYNEYYRDQFTEEELPIAPSRIDRCNSVMEMTKEIKEIYSDNCRSMRNLFSGQKEEDFLSSPELHRNLRE